MAETIPTGHGHTRVMIERAMALGLVALLLLGVMWVLQPFAMAILFGAFITIATWPLRQAVVRAGLSPAQAATGMLLLVLLVVALPIILLAPMLPEQIASLSERLRAALAQAPANPPSLLASIPVVKGYAQEYWPRLQAAQGDIKALMAPWSGQITRLLVNLGQGLVESVLQILLSLIVTAMFWANGSEMAHALRDIIGRIGGPVAAAMVDEAGGAVRGVAWGVIGTALLQAVILGLGLSIAGVPGPLVLGFLTFVFSVTQILAPAMIPIWAGAAWWLFGQDQAAWAVFMLAVGVTVSFGDNIIRPLLISRGSAMPLTLIILGVFGGIIAFGFLGLFVGPALLAVGYGLLKVWREQGLGAAD
ncbi:MAG: AI-2E family transporter [Rhodospirillales bacterium]|nr:AI-2E family transporter [Rhodospirillales bacterium]